MNWLLICVIATVVLCALYGYWKGFLRILFSMVSVLLLLAVVTITTPYISSFLEEHTSVQKTIEQQCLEHIRKTTQQQMEDTLTNEKNDKQKLLEEAGIHLPESAWEKVLDSGADATNDILETSGLYEAVAQSVAQFVVNGIASIIALIVGVILLFLVARVLNIVSKLPVIKEVNHFLGVASGLVLALVLIWLFFYFVMVMCTSSFGIMMTQYIRDSKVLTWLYENNMLLYVVMMWF